MRQAGTDGSPKRVGTRLARGATCLAWLAALAGCGRDARDPFFDSRPPPGLAERFYPPENWAWGELQVAGAPAQRYGVAATGGVARAQVLILSDYGESAETWFETARDLTQAGDVVWVLEGVGQGGSGRITGRRDLGELRDFDADVGAVKAMIETVIRPEPRQPLVLLGHGVGALVAARAAETGAGADALVLSAPACWRARPGGALVFLGLGRSRAPGGDAWSRRSPDDFAAHRTHDAWRGAVTQAWQLVNPDLRLGGPSLDWAAAVDRLAHAARDGQASLATPTLVVDTDRSAGCLAPPLADTRLIAGAGDALELEDDARRGVWLAAIQRVVDATVRRADPPPAPKPG